MTTIAGDRDGGTCRIIAIRGDQGHFMAREAQRPQSEAIRAVFKSASGCGVSDRVFGPGVANG